MQQLFRQLIFWSSCATALVCSSPCRADAPILDALPANPQGLLAQSTQILQESLTLQPPPAYIADFGNPFAPEYATARLDAARELLLDKSALGIDYIAQAAKEPRGPAQGELVADLFHYAPDTARRVLSSWLEADRPYFDYDNGVAALWRFDPALARREFSKAIAARRKHLVHSFTEVTNRVAPRQLDSFLPLMLRQKDDRIRLLAAIELAKRGDASGLAVLSASVRGERTEHFEMFGDQRLVVKALGAIYHKGGRDVLMAMLPDARFFGSGSSFGDVAAYEILERATPRDLPVVRDLMKKEDLRFWAFQELPRLDPKHSPAIMRSVLQNKTEDVSVRLWAAFTLARGGDEMAIRFLEESCPQNLGLGGTPARYLLQAKNEKARQAYLRVLKLASTSPRDKRAEAATSCLLSSFDDYLMPEDIFPVWAELLSAAPKMSDSDGSLKYGFWSKIAEYRGPLTRLQPILWRGLNYDKGKAVLQSLGNVSIVTPSEKEYAVALLMVLTESPQYEVALEAAELGYRKGLLSPETVRQVSLHCLNNGHIKAFQQLAQTATLADLASVSFFQRWLSPLPKKTAEKESPPARVLSEFYNNGASVQAGRELTRVYAAIVVHRVSRKAKMDEQQSNKALHPTTQRISSPQKTAKPAGAG